MPTDGDGTSIAEAAWTGYARIPITNNSANFPAASAVSHIATVICQAAINFAAVAGLGSPITVVGVALYSLATGGNLGRTAVFGTPAAPATYTLSNGSSLSIAAENLSFQEA